MNLIEMMQSHQESGGSLFDCPSFSASKEERQVLMKAINSIFNETFKDYKPSCAHNSEQDLNEMK